MRTRSLLFASALVLAGAAGILAVNGVHTSHAADDTPASQAEQGTQQQTTPAANSDTTGKRDAAGTVQTGPVQTGEGPMPLEEIVRTLGQQGYSDIREVERESKDRYEVYARDSQGQRVELKVDAMTGEVLHSEDED